MGSTIAVVDFDPGKSPMVLGWVGIARCEELAGGGSYLRLQITWSVFALAAMLATTLPSYRVLCRFSYGFFASRHVLLVLVYLFPPVNGARRWIRLGPLGLQPSEFAKVAFVMALARYLMYRDNYRRLGGLWLPLALTFLPVRLILSEPDLGTSLVFLPVLFVMLFAAGALAMAPGVPGSGGHTLPAPCLDADEPGPEIAGYGPFRAAGPGRADHAAVPTLSGQAGDGLGRRVGQPVRGPAIEDPAAYRLPEARSDFIFCILAERLGLPGMALLLLCMGCWSGEDWRSPWLPGSRLAGCWPWD